MTEEQLAAAGWKPVGLVNDGIFIYSKQIGGAVASVKQYGDHWRGWAERGLVAGHLICQSARPSGTLPASVHYAESMARAIEACLSGDEATALEHARQAAEPPPAEDNR